MSNQYKIDPAHSSANFSIKHMMISKVHGGFDKISGMFVYDPQNPELSVVNAEIEVASINTREAQRDGHLKSADFFDVENHPLMVFKSKSFKRTGDDLLVVLGELSIRGVTKEVTLQVEGPTAEMKDPWGNLKSAISASTKISRKEFGLTWNAALETGGVLVGDEVTITLDVQFARA